MVVFRFVRGLVLDNRGSAAVETAFVFPIVLISIVSLFLMMIFLHDSAVSRAKLHISLRNEAGAIAETEKVEKHKAKLQDAKVEWTNGQRAIRGQSNLTFRAFRFIKSKNKVIYGRAYSISEKKMVRYEGLAEDIL